MEWVASTLYTTSEHGVSNITTADAHTSPASSRLNWRPCRFKWTRPFRRKTNLVSAQSKRDEVVPAHALKVYGGVRGVAPLARQIHPIPWLTLNAHDSEFVEVALLITLDHSW